MGGQRLPEDMVTPPGGACSYRVPHVTRRTVRTLEGFGTDLLCFLPPLPKGVTVMGSPFTPQPGDQHTAEGTLGTLW